jgi:serine/threonine protein kinase
MASALHYLDSKKISHNDIRPANILFKRGQPCILLDFGSACSHDEVNLWSMCHYLCPEYLWSRRRGAKSDIFSLGVVMLWVLRQIPLPEATEWTWDAIQAASVPDSPHAIKARDWQRRLLLSRERLANHSRVKHLVYRMLDPNPETRISIQELIKQA